MRNDDEEVSGMSQSNERGKLWSRARRAGVEAREKQSQAMRSGDDRGERWSRAISHGNEKGKTATCDESGR